MVLICCQNVDERILNVCDDAGIWSGAEVRKSCRPWKILQNSNKCLLAKIEFDTTENEPSKRIILCSHPQDFDV